MPDGRVLPTEGLTEPGPDLADTARRVSRRCIGCTMAGNAVLERTTWLGKYIPLIRVEGQRLNVNGQVKRTGMMQAGRDAQVSVDVYSTMEATAIMAAPKSPWLLYAEQISGYEKLLESGQ